MKKLFTLLTLLVAIVTGAQAADATFTMSSIFTGSNTSATVTDPVAATITSTANAGNAAQGKLGSDGNYFQVVLESGTFTAVSFNGYINTTNTEKNWAFQFSTDGGTTWSSEVTQANDGNKTAHDISVGVTIPANANGFRVIRRAGTSTIVNSITLTLDGGGDPSDTRTNLVGAWSAATSTFDFGSTATAPTFAVTGGTAGTDYSVAYSLTTDGGNVTVNSTSGITAIDTNTPGTSKVKATITVINETDYKATTTEYETTITVKAQEAVLTATNNYFWKFSNTGWTTGDIAETTIIDNMKVYASSSKKVNIATVNSTIDTETFTYQMKFGGTGNASERSVQVKVIAPCKITLYGASSSSGTVRTCNIAVGSFSSVVETLETAPAASVSYDLTGTGEQDVYVYSANSGFNIYGLKVEPSATDTYTVTFDAGSNGTCATTSLTETAPGAGVTLPEVTANTGYGFTGWYTDASDETTKVGDAGAKYNPAANITLTAGYSALAAPTISVAADKTTAAKNESVTLTATVDGTPEPTIQWYSNTTASNEGGTAIEGATATTYAPSTATPNTYYFYAVATNSQGSATSAVQTITVTASNDCVLNQVVFSNTFDAFIKAPTAEVLYTAEDQEVIDGTKNVGDVKVAAANGTIKAYYMAGTTEPTITSTVNVSDGATYAVSGNTLTVTAEDGTTTAAYDITVEAVTPYDGVGKLTFDGTETWVKSGYGFSTESGKLGYKIAKTDNDWSRERDGRTRIYFFLAPTATVTFENGGTARNIKVYKNGTLLSTPTSTSSCEIEGDTENNFMIAIVSNQTNGDGALKSITTPVPTLTLDDTSNGNAAKIAALNGKTANVTVERNLATTYYNTLFLPFAMTAEQIQAAFGEGAQVATFTGMNSETQFGFGNVTAMEANVPYLVKPAQEVNGFTVEGVTISNTTAAGVVSGGYSMVGTYDTFTNGSSTSGSSIGGGISIGGGSSSTPNEIYYFATTGKIKKLTSTGSIKGLRAFMVKLPAGKTSVETIVSNAGIKFGGAGSGQARARQDFVLNLDDDNTTTGIEAIENGQLTIDNDAPAYNLAGQKVGKGYKGIVIINGKKVVK